MNLQIFLEEEKEASRGADLNESEVENATQMAVNRRRELIRILVDFVVKKFGLKPTAYQKTSVARAAIIVFPRLAFKNSQIGGIVSVCYYLVKKKGINSLKFNS